MKRLTASLLALGLIGVACAADANDPSQPIGTVIKGFSMPQLDANGKPTNILSGDEAKIVSVNRTEIINMKIEVYDGNEVSTVITSPKCDLWRAIDHLRTREGVVIKRKDMEMSSQSMDWEYKEKRGILRDNVKVVLTNFSMNKPANDKSPSPPPIRPPEPTVPTEGSLIKDGSDLLQSTSPENSAPLTQ